MTRKAQWRSHILAGHASLLLGAFLIYTATITLAGAGWFALGVLLVGGVFMFGASAIIYRAEKYID